MLKRNQQLRTQILQLKDALLFAVALWLAYEFRVWFGHLLLYLGDANQGSTLKEVFTREIEAFADFAWLYLIIIPGAPLVLESLGFYSRPALFSRRATAWMLLKGCALVTMGVILVMFLFKMNLARFVIILFGLISFLLVLLAEELLRLGYKTRFGQLQLEKRLIIVGSPKDTASMRAELEARQELGLRIVSELNLNDETIRDLVSMLHERAANGVILMAKHASFANVEKAIQACELEGVEAWLVADFFQTQISRTTFDDFFGRPVLVFRTVPEASWEGVIKQIIDLVGALVLLALLSVIYVPVAILIKLTSPGPILFRQQRCGLNGRPFTMLKFRSMVTNAEQRQAELAALNEMDGPVFKVTNDPRVTPIGRWLRKYSIDEVPQLFNVLRGEMSLVGPRPLPVDEVERFDDPAHRRRLSVKPGMTCLWQISGRNEVRDFRDWVRLDLEYIDNWSLWLDLKIMWRTIPVVLAGVGAK
jgi:exopolysaccharide biosynthesis polyprenyl glycosylphosphotransferase